MLAPILVQRNIGSIVPNRLWLADFTYVHTMSDFCYTAFFTDIFSRKIVGWGVSSSMYTLGMPVITLVQALFQAQWDTADSARIMQYSVRGSQYVSESYTLV